jgi:predicted O-methyltransferase YrrM
VPSAESLDSWIRRVLSDPDLTRMGHAQKPETADLGLGWIYYGLARVINPPRAVVIGSFRGFVPLVIARALADNGSGASVEFVDPSLVDDFWSDADRVQSHFRQFGLTNVRHHRMTTQEFVKSEAYRTLDGVELAFIDGYNSYEQAKFDFEALEPLVSARGAWLFHDSIRIRPTRIYGPDKVYEHRVRDLMVELRANPAFQVFDVPYGDGLTLVRRPAVPEGLFT